jgi:hypothetical protein
VWGLLLLAGLKHARATMPLHMLTLLVALAPPTLLPPSWCEPPPALPSDPWLVRREMGGGWSCCCCCW